MSVIRISEDYSYKRYDSVWKHNLWKIVNSAERALPDDRSKENLPMEERMLEEKESCWLPAYGPNTDISYSF